MDDRLLYLFVAYTVIWAALLIYAFSIAKRQKGVERDIESLREALKEREKTPVR